MSDVQSRTTHVGARGSKAKPKARRRTPAQCERQFRAFQLSVVDSKTVREIAAELGVDKATIVSDIRHEGERRADAIAERRSNEIGRSVSVYEAIFAKAMRKSAMADALVAKIIKGEGKGIKVSDRHLDAALKARERIDRVLGLEAAIKVDAGLNTLLDALAPKD